MTETKKFQVYFPIPVYERLRRAAFDQRTSMNQLVVAAVVAAHRTAAPTPKKRRP